MSHGMRSPLLAAVHDTSCLSCLKQYHCTDRLLQHLQAVPACFHRVSQNVEAMDTEALQVMRGLERDILRAAQRTGKGRPVQLRMPCIRLHGPLTRWASDEPAEAHVLAASPDCIVPPAHHSASLKVFAVQLRPRVKRSQRKKYSYPNRGGLTGHAHHNPFYVSSTEQFDLNRY